MLIEAEFDPDMPDRNSIAPVHRAAATGHAAVFQEILTHAKTCESVVTDSEG